MLKWERQLGVYHSLLEELTNEREKSEGKLRFCRPFIIASDVAQQYFCEKKVEMQYLHGDVETAEKTVGTEAHEKLLADSVKIRERARACRSFVDSLNEINSLYSGIMLVGVSRSNTIM